MMHFFRKSELHIDCFTSRKAVAEYAPIVSAIETIPDWWKALPKKLNKEFFPTPTMKTCVGMYDYYAKSIAMPLWSDLCISVAHDGSYTWQFSDLITEAGPHPKWQYEGLPLTGRCSHLKINSPWVFVTKQNVDWVLTDPIYNRNSFKEYFIAQGLLNFSKQHATNVQMFIDVANPITYTIPFNTPFFFTPMSDKKVVIHRHLISAEKYNAISSMSNAITFINKYKTQQKVTKCPYKDEMK